MNNKVVDVQLVMVTVEGLAILRDFTEIGIEDDTIAREDIEGEIEQESNNGHKT